MPEFEATYKKKRYKVTVDSKPISSNSTQEPVQNVDSIAAAAIAASIAAPIAASIAAPIAAAASIE